MSYENATLEKVKADLEHVDIETLRSIQQIIEQSKHRPKAARDGKRRVAGEQASGEPVRFIGENLTLEAYQALSIDERRKHKQTLRERNHHWLRQTFSSMGAAWLVVLDGRIIEWGKSLKDQPLQPELRKICQQTGKFPFVFINENFLAIEEGGSEWQKIRDSGDYYPTLPVTLGSTFHSVDIIGDLDTGAARTFVDYNFLVFQKVIKPEIEDNYEISRHLDQFYEYVAKLPRVCPKTSPKASRLAFATCKIVAVNAPGDAFGLVY